MPTNMYKCLYRVCHYFFIFPQLFVIFIFPNLCCQDTGISHYGINKHILIFIYITRTLASTLLWTFTCGLGSKFLLRLILLSGVFTLPTHQLWLCIFFPLPSVLFIICHLSIFCMLHPTSPLHLAVSVTASDLFSLFSVP